MEKWRELTNRGLIGGATRDIYTRIDWISMAGCQSNRDGGSVIPLFRWGSFQSAFLRSFMTTFPTNETKRATGQKEEGKSY